MMKSVIKLLFLKIRLRKVRFSNLKPWTFIGKYTIIQTDRSSLIRFNDRISINHYVTLLALDHAEIVFGERTSIGDYSSIRATRARIEIGSNTMIAQQVQLVSTNHYYKSKDQLIVEQDIDEHKKGIKIGSDCWLGAGCIILPGIEIGDGAVIGAGAIVTRSIPPYAVAVGNPARIVSYRQ